jgi:hypothetical protein
MRYRVQPQRHFWVEQGATKSRSPPFPGPLLGDFVETTYNVAHWGGKQAADTKQSPERYRLSGFDLLPIAHGVSVGNHVFLAEARSLTKRFDAYPEALEESGFVLHDLFVSDLVL